MKAIIQPRREQFSEASLATARASCRTVSGPGFSTRVGGFALPILRSLTCVSLKLAAPFAIFYVNRHAAFCRQLIIIGLVVGGAQAFAQTSSTPAAQGTPP